MSASGTMTARQPRYSRSAGRFSSLELLGTGGFLNQCPYKTQEGLMLRAMSAVREEIRDA
jgi:hypothetical protein